MGGVVLFCGWAYAGKSVIDGHWGYTYESDDYVLSYVPTHVPTKRFRVNRKRADGRVQWIDPAGPTGKAVVKSFVSCGHDAFSA